LSVPAFETRIPIVSLQKIFPKYFVACVVLALISVIESTAQEHVGQFSQADVENGFRLYGANCTTCHGENGDGVPGIDLRRGQFRRASSDADLILIIANGIPGTAMPPHRFVSADLAGLVAYIRSLRDFDRGTVAIGDAGRGQKLFEGKGGCAKCHRVNGKGSRVGPDLSDIGAIRAPDSLQKSIIDPNSAVLPINRPIRAVSRNGQVIRGRRLNEDTYTVQIMDEQERLMSLDKTTLREYTVVKTSSMPAYKDELTAEELSDIVAYLRSLKGMR
jgi:putative heme-binding domain-containing protein